MSQTPTYDQLRGERINADVPASDVDVPASESDLDPRTHLGRHHLREDGSTAASVCGSSLGSGVDLAGDWAGFGTGDGDTLGAETFGLLHLMGAHFAARDSDAVAAADHLGEAGRIALLTGERNGLRQHFGPTNVNVWRVAIGAELG